MTRRFLVSGRVQGVGYRYFAQGEAQRLGIVGFAANLADGRVEVMAIGEEPALEQLEAALRRGPRAAQVASVIVEPAATNESYTTFSTR